MTQVQSIITSERADAVRQTTRALQDAIDRTADSGGGRVTITPGVHESGALRLRSHVELHLEQGAVLRFVPDPALYPLVGARWEGATAAIHSPCVYARNATDVSITGAGEIDGGGQWWWDAFREGTLAHPRPTLLAFHGCTRVEVSGVTLIDSPSWTVHPLLCDDVRIVGVRIINPADSPNTDGIDPESCRDVLIDGCHIDVGDDCIAIKSGSEGAAERVACERITITGCRMLHGHGGVVIGSEMSGDVRGVTISDCVFEGTDRGIRIKTRRGRGGVVEDVQVSDITMDAVMCPIVVNPFYFCGPDGRLPQVSDRRPRPVDEGTPHIRDIRLARISATNVQACAAFISGLPEAPIAGLILEQIDISFAADPEPAVPAMAEGVPAMAAAGILLAFASDVHARGVRLTGVRGVAVATEDVTGTPAEAWASA
ncbi:glycoside hydrolase family 28 protein [Microbacterium sp. Sa4CUA7]|uniref:Glycoside hydrolase family 28 protein n=1 Tax=Microbacterium pullorum TaxID=2762236 RepID=A0ABR8RZ36_9MICO|nr:glycoside hydrolase family 28 protein [Microbacterium pullorum]MBD7956493.1 glycoside hydrolase family 28 protein [Microbacterium pullorum]